MTRKPTRRTEPCRTCGGSGAYKEGKCPARKGKGMQVWELVEEGKA